MNKKKIFNWRVWMGVGLILLTVIFYFLHYILFHDRHHIFIYFWGDVAFIPLEVLLVTLIIHHLLEKREKRRLLNKMNMLIGAFFSEAGTDLLRMFSKLDPAAGELKGKLTPDAKWTEKEFKGAKIIAAEHECGICASAGDLSPIKDFLNAKRGFFMGLLANPTLLEHDSFTDLLWAVFHMTEELSNRKDIGSVPKSDLEHIALDAKRAYKALINEWLDYMKHLKEAYPYLFSLAVRTNPFDPEANIEVA